ncbi:MAG: YjbQ family protein [Anaerolineae bacterium]|nr:YjbQ family protein [Anaerolineae bacterium]
MLTEISLRTGVRTELVDITLQIQEAINQSGVTEGLCHIFSPHTTAGITLNENWDPAVRQDLVTALDSLIPAAGPYQHAEGNSPAHIKAMLTGFSATCPVRDGRLVLGTWQGIYLAEWDGPRQRHLYVTIQPI